jgi:hypothetical protein
MPSVTIRSSTESSLDLDFIEPLSGNNMRIGIQELLYTVLKQTECQVLANCLRMLHRKRHRFYGREGSARYGH